MMNLFTRQPKQTRRFESAFAMPDLDLFFPTQEAADKLGFTVQGVARLIRQKKLEAIRVGKMYLVSKQSVEDYLKITKGKDKNDPRRGKKPNQ